MATLTRRTRKAPSRRASSAVSSKSRISNASTKPTSALRIRAERLLAKKIEFIPSDRFADPKQVAELMQPHPPVVDPAPATTTRRPSGLTPYLSSLYETALLSSEDEAFLFRKMNFLKYRAAELREDLDADHPRAELMNRIDVDLREADEIKNQLIRANLRLVVSVAKKFVEASNQLSELISDGNISLMRAVEKFDADRGFKFSTYATYAIRRNFFRTIIQARKERQRYVSGDDDLLKLSAAGPEEQQISEPQFVQLKNWLGKLLSQLSPREQLIMSLRFGLDKNSEPQTLQDIAKSMGVCKERVRQLQSRAMAKLQKAAEAVKSEVGELL
jgi:RNA polymerase sigma factor (sigma-70 family)